MSEASSQEKTEKATPKRQRQARERGEVPRSRELLTATIVAASVLCLMAFGGHMANQAAGLMRSGLSIDPALLDDPGQLSTAFGRMLVQSLWLILPLLIAALVATLVAPVLLGGWNVSAQALHFKILETVERICCGLHVEFHPVRCAFQHSSIALRKYLQALPHRLPQHRCVKPHPLIGMAVCAAKIQDKLQQFL